MIKDVIKALCAEKNISFMKLESDLGLGSGAISKWDKSSPKVENIQKVADYFKVSVDYLLGRSTDPHKFQPAYLGARPINEEASDEQVARALALFAQMSDEEKEKAIHQIEMVLAYSKMKKG